MSGLVKNKKKKEGNGGGGPRNDDTGKKERGKDLVWRNTPKDFATKLSSVDENRKEN